MVHIVFNEVEIELMQKVQELDNTLAGDILQIKDDFAVGPLNDLDTDAGWDTRVAWWKMLLEKSSYNTDIAGSFDDRQTVNIIREKLIANPDEQVYIWMAQNQHDVCGYYWLMPQLKDFQGRVMVLYLNNLPFINEKGQIFYPSWLSEILPTEFLKAKKLARPVTTSEFELDSDEWRKLMQENAIVRILDGGKKIINKSEDFYDDEIIKNITNQWQKAWRILSNTSHRMKIKTGDVFLMWRIKQMIDEGKIIVEGDVTNWKNFDIKVSPTPSS